MGGSGIDYVRDSHGGDYTMSSGDFTPRREAMILQISGRPSRRRRESKTSASTSPPPNGIGRQAPQRATASGLTQIATQSTTRAF
jgi:hypothetical protein